MTDLAYLCTGFGMIWGSFQDFKTHTVSLPPLLLWCLGSCVWCAAQGVGYGLLFALIYIGLLHKHIHTADGLALCASSAWFTLDAIPLMFLSTALGCLALHAITRKSTVPMLPPIAAGWFVTHFWTQVTHATLVVSIGALRTIGCATWSVVDVLQSLL